jgi:hypothetical protein
MCWGGESKKCILNLRWDIFRKTSAWRNRRGCGENINMRLGWYGFVLVFFYLFWFFDWSLGCSVSASVNKTSSFSCRRRHRHHHHHHHYFYLAGKHEGTKQLGRHRHRWWDNIKIGLKKYVGLAVEWLRRNFLPCFAVTTWSMWPAKSRAFLLAHTRTSLTQICTIVLKCDLSINLPVRVTACII